MTAQRHPHIPPARSIRAQAIAFLAAALPQVVDRDAGRPSWFAGAPRRSELLGASGGLAMVGLGAGVALFGREN
jgi:hypothetical protein